MAGTRLLIIQSFLAPFLLYVVIVCFGFGFFHHPDHRNFLATTTEVAPLLWKRLSDAAWVNVALPILIHIPASNATTEKALLDIKWTNDAIAALRTFPTHTTARDRNESCTVHSERTHFSKGITRMTLLFDQAVSNWKEYLHHIQTWIDRVNQQQNLRLLSTLCPNIYPIELMNVHRTDAIRKIAVSDHHSDPNLYHRYLSTTDHNLVTLLSSDEYKSEHAQHILLHVPSETTYLIAPNNLRNNTASMENIVQISIGAEPTTATDSRASSYFGIINPNDDDDSMTTSITTLLDQIYNQYFWNCLLAMDVVPNAASDDATTESYLMLCYHRTFSKWYKSLIDHLESTWLEMVSIHQEPSMYVHDAWSSTSLLIPAQNKLRLLVADLMKWKASTNDTDGSPSWLYRTNHQDTYERLQQIEESIVQLGNNVNDMKLIVKQSGSRIIDLDVVIHDLPIEQHLAIFGPLLFPLVVPLLITLVRECVRLRNHQRALR